MITIGLGLKTFHELRFYMIGHGIKLDYRRVSGKRWLAVKWRITKVVSRYYTPHMDVGSAVMVD